MGADAELLVDPSVSRAKFAKEIESLRRFGAEYHSRGLWLIEATYPSIFVIMASPKPKPPAVVCGVLFDFTNYDLWPPSVCLVDPFTRIPYKANELPITLNRRGQVSAEALQAAAAAGHDPKAIIAEQPMMQWHEPEAIPFLCLPGVREYHQHPAHTGDSWFLRRGTAEGGLIYLLEQLHRYGVAPINGYQVQMQMVAQIAGFTRSEVPA